MVITAADLKKLKPGDIMVCPTSQSSYTPVFPLLKGLVCDGGGSLSHGPIVGREWDIPVVANCITGTRLLKDGDRGRVDGFKGLVYKLLLKVEVIISGIKGYYPTDETMRLLHGGDK